MRVWMRPWMGRMRRAGATGQARRREGVRAWWMRRTAAGPGWQSPVGCCGTRHSAVPEHRCAECTNHTPTALGSVAPAAAGLHSTHAQDTETQKTQSHMFQQLNIAAKWKRRKWITREWMRGG